MFRRIEKGVKAKEALAKRIYDAKNRRMDDVKKPNRKESATTGINKAFRRLQSIIDMQEAQLRAVCSSADAANAMVRVHVAHVHVLQLEVARLRRTIA